MTRVLFTNSNISWNKGSAAQVISTRNTLKELIPDASFALLSVRPNLDSGQCRLYGIEVVSSAWFRIPNVRILTYVWHKIFFPLCFIVFSGLILLGLKGAVIKDPVIKAYTLSDIIIDLSGDSYTDSIGGYSWSISSTLLLAFALKKKVVLYSQSIGMFGNLYRPLARYCLNKASLIIVREKITLEYLHRIKVTNKHLYLTADCAFLLDPSPKNNENGIFVSENIELQKKPLIGVSASATLEQKGGNYINSMAKIIGYLIEKLGAQVMFVPHVISPNKYMGLGDDRRTAINICKRIKRRTNIFFVMGDYSPSDLKGIIGLCDLFISGRMHAAIAALSSNVPTAVTSWSHKYAGIMETVGMSEYVLDSKSLKAKEFQSLIDKLWDNRAMIKKELKLNVKEQQSLAEYSGRLVADLLVNSD
jgi:polysaccharide pyruvyl transferase WcaK-like protein